MRGRKITNKTQDYFGQREEEAIKEFLSSETSEKRKNELFSKCIEPAFRKLIQGVLTMPKFQKIIGLFKDFDCEEGAYHHLLINMHKFDSSRIGKDGKPVKAYSYYGTTVKNYILALKMQADKLIANYGGIKEISEVGEELKSSQNDFKIFEDLKSQILKILNNEPLGNSKLSKNDIIVIECLKYMLNNWNKLDFQNKNQFNRLLICYTQLPANTVMNSLKKIKNNIIKQELLIINEEF